MSTEANHTGSRPREFLYSINFRQPMHITFTRLASPGVIVIILFMAPIRHVTAQWNVTPQSVELLSPGPVSGITEMSGVTFLGSTGSNHHFAAVQDSGNQLALFDVIFTNDGSISSATATGDVSLAPGFDFEGIAFTNPSRNSVYISEETTPTVREYDLSSGNMLQVLSMPAVFEHIRGNRGLESLTRTVGGTVMWTANEESLTVDGPAATTTGGTVVRLQQLLVDDDSVVPAAQYAYDVSPVHDVGFAGQQQSGLTDLVALPDGTVLTLERSFAALASPTYLGRIYQIDFSSATDISQLPLTASLAGQIFTPVDKQLLASFVVGSSGENLEGLTLGPRLANGHWTLLGVVDDGGPFSNNTVASFEISPPSCISASDINCSGTVDEFDYMAWKDTFSSTSLLFADVSHNGTVDAADYTLWRADSAANPANESSIPEPEPHVLFLIACAFFALIIGQPDRFLGRFTCCLTPKLVSGTAQRSLQRPA